MPDGEDACLASTDPQSDSRERVRLAHTRRRPRSFAKGGLLKMKSSQDRVPALREHSRAGVVLLADAGRSNRSGAAADGRTERAPGVAMDLLARGLGHNGLRAHLRPRPRVGSLQRVVPQARGARLARISTGQPHGVCAQTKPAGGRLVGWVPPWAVPFGRPLGAGVWWGGWYGELSLWAGVWWGGRSLQGTFRAGVCGAGGPSFCMFVLVSGAPSPRWCPPPKKIIK